MATINARKFFSRMVTVPSNQAVSLATLMRNAPGVVGEPPWGQNADGSPSMDSMWGDGATIIPASQTMYVGNSASVSAVNSPTSYIGVPVTAAQAFVLNDYWPCPIDMEIVFIYSVNAQQASLIFQGRQ